MIFYDSKPIITNIEANNNEQNCYHRLYHIFLVILKCWHKNTLSRCLGPLVSPSRASRVKTLRPCPKGGYTIFRDWPYLTVLRKWPWQNQEIISLWSVQGFCALHNNQEVKQMTMKAVTIYCSLWTHPTCNRYHHIYCVTCNWLGQF